MGKKIVLTGEKLSNLDAPRLRVYDELESAGTLALFDVTHPMQEFGSGIPTDGSVVKNLARVNAAGLYGEGATADQMDLGFVLQGNVSGAAGKIERTGSGGIHGIISQSAAVQGGFAVMVPAKVVHYLMKNRLRSYYASFWGRITRRPPTLDDMMFTVNGNGQQTNSFAFSFENTKSGINAWAQRPYSGSNLGFLFDPAAAPTVPSPVFRSIGMPSGWYTATAGKESSLPGDGANQGVTGAWGGGGASAGAVNYSTASAWKHAVQASGAVATSNAGSSFKVQGGSPSNYQSCGSQVVYRFYIEDLTASGRTYAQVRDLDYALYQREVLTAGGRYYGDTHTDPTTIP